MQPVRSLNTFLLCRAKLVTRGLEMAVHIERPFESVHSMNFTNSNHSGDRTLNYYKLLNLDRSFKLTRILKHTHISK